uniref:Protein delta homolog 1 n=1 Tax=Prolemur simus TaxID=1328070 RepID=A0A8C9AR83_PROSS
MTGTEALLPVLLLLLAFGHGTHGGECPLTCDPTHGTCVDDNICRCRPGWQGALCDQCMTSPGCVYGICEEPWQCLCSEGWGGEFCDIDMRPCNLMPCANNGTCVNREGGQYECFCTLGFAGPTCERDYGPCAIEGSPCKNQGACVDDDGEANFPSCRCRPGFSGNFCEIVVNSCIPNPCKNDGVCTDIGGDFRCRCPTGFVDKTCSQAVNNCGGIPCLNGGTCSQHSQGQAVCFTILGVITSLVLLGTLGIVFLNKCEGWASVLRRAFRLRRNNVLLHYQSGEDLAVNIIFPEKIDMTTLTRETMEEAI